MQFHLYLPQMRTSFDRLVASARAAESAGFTGIAGMDHLAPPGAQQQSMYEAMVTSTWLAGITSPESRAVLAAIASRSSGSPAAGVLAVAWLLALDVGLCGLAVVVGRHPRTLATLERAGAWVTPLVYCAIGVAVLVRAGTLRHLF